MAVDDLPHLDEHSVVVAAPAEDVWDATTTALARSFGSPAARRVAAALRPEPAAAEGWEQLQVGSALPGIRVVRAERPTLLVVAGRHRFAAYGIVVRIEPGVAGTTCRVESRAEFPGPHGRVYRAAVIGSRGHAVVVRRLLGEIRRDAEARARAAS